MMMDVIKTLKEKHPYLDDTAMELFEHYAKEYDRELDLIIEVELRKFAREIWEMSKALYDKTVLDSGVNRDNYNALCRINKKCAELLEGGKSDKEEL